MTIFRTFSEQEDHFVLKTLPLKDKIKFRLRIHQWERRANSNELQLFTCDSIYILSICRTSTSSFFIFIHFLWQLSWKMLRSSNVSLHNFTISFSRCWGNKISRPVAIAFSNSKPKFEWRRRKRSFCATQLLYQVFLQYSAARKSEGRRPWTTYVSKKLRWTSEGIAFA